MEIQADTLNPQ